MASGEPETRLISAVLVNWNHGQFLPGCLEALHADGRRLLEQESLEIVVVDNGSTDGSPEWLARHYPTVRLIRFPDNRGFAHALNQAVRSTTGDYVLSLNPDVVVDPGFLCSLVDGIREPLGETGAQVGMAAPKLLRAENRALLDSTGLFVDRRRRPYDRGQGEPDRGQYDTHTDVWGPCGAAALYRRDMLQDIAGVLNPPESFDETFFAYCEDADLAWRAQLRGWRCRYVPGAVAKHVRGWGDTLRKPGHASKGSQGPRLALRNRYLMTIKNDAWRFALRDLPRILAAELPRLAFLAVSRPRALLALVDLARACPEALHKRRQIRSCRLVADTALRRWFLVSPRQRADARERGQSA
jgi:GT2 family glycosyltransferase